MNSANRPLLLGLLSALAAGVVGFALWPRDRSDSSSTGRDEAGRAPSPEEEAATLRGTPHADPYVELGLSFDQAVDYLLLPSTDTRGRVLRYLVTQDVRDRRLLPALLAVIEQMPEEHELRALAMVVVMHIHGDTRYARALADLAARSPGGKAEAILIEYAPEVGGLLARGTRMLVEAQRSGLADGPRAEVEEFLSLAVGSPAVATERLRLRLSAASPNDVLWLTGLALGVRPVPSELAGAVKSTLALDASGPKEALLTALQDERADYGPVAASLASVLNAAIREGLGPNTPHAVTALGWLPQFSAETQATLRLALGKPETAAAALAAYARLGVRMAPAVTNVLEAAQSAPSGQLPLFTSALVRSGAAECVPFLRDRMLGGSDSEALEILQHLPTFGTGSDLIPDVIATASARGVSVRARAAEVLASLDPRLARDASSTALASWLGAPEVDVVLGSLRGLGNLEAVRPNVVDAALAALDSDVPAIAHESVDQVGRFGRLASSREVLLPRLRRRYEAGASLPPRGRGALLEAMAALASQDSEIRSLLAAALGPERPLGERQGALRGLLHVKDPTRNEYYLVAAQAMGRGTDGPAERVLRAPAWREFRRRHNIPTSLSER